MTSSVYWEELEYPTKQQSFDRKTGALCKFIGMCRAHHLAVRIKHTTW